MKYFLGILLGITIMIGSQSCKSVYQNAMFKNVDSTSIVRTINKSKDSYMIQPGDELSIKLFTRDGSSLIEFVANNGGASVMNQNAKEINYMVNSNGEINLPILGMTPVKGMTESSLKIYLEEKLKKTYQNPYVVTKVENKRVFVFKGSIGQVINLNAQSPTSIFEILAKSGGLERHISTTEIQIIRGDYKNPKVYLVDLSTYQGIKNSELYLEPNDIVYVPERKRALYHALSDIAPVVTLPLSILTSMIGTIVLIVTLSK